MSKDNDCPECKCDVALGMALNYVKDLDEDFVNKKMEQIENEEIECMTALNEVIKKFSDKPEVADMLGYFKDLATGKEEVEI